MEEFNSVSFPSQKCEAIVTQLYQELKLVRQFTGLMVHHVEELNLTYLTGIDSDTLEIFFPIAADETVTLKTISSLQKCLQQRHMTSRVTLALMDSDSTTVFFNITSGFVAPPDATTPNASDTDNLNIPQDQTLLT